MQGVIELVAFGFSLFALTFVFSKIILEYKRDVIKVFTAFIIAAFLYGLLYLAEVLAMDLSTKLLFARMQYIPIITLPLIWLLFIELYLNEKIKTGFKIFVGVLALFLMVYTVFIPGPNAFWGEAYVVEHGVISLVNYQYNWLYYFGYIPYAYGLYVGTAVWLFFRYIKSPKLVQKQISVLMAAIFMPLVFNLLYALNVGLINHFNCAPIALGVSALLVLFNMKRYRFLRFLPVSKDLILDYLDQGVILIDPQGDIVELNEVAKTILELPKYSVGKNIFQIQDSLSQNMIYKANSEGSVTFTIIKNDEKYIYHTDVRFLKTSKDVMAGILITFKDNTQFIKLYEEYKYIATYDTLTGAFSRKVFLDKTEKLFKQERAKAVYINIDINHFKDVNDNFGHSVGDQVLIDLVRALRDILPKKATIGRLGGDEFAVSMKIDDDLDVLIDKLKTMSKYDDALPNYTISVGAASWRPTCDTIDCIMHHADVSMYKDKKRKE